ncbi:hypothetical protein FRB98_002365 [Tulasnella sp. 332]|nr:hypothetical protein FRB98_002365 [Tulasnella sp. 332]
MASVSSVADSNVIAALAAGLALYVAFRKWGSSTRNDGVESLPRAAAGHWLWGNEKEAWSTPESGFFTAGAKRYGFTFTLKGALFHPDIIYTGDPAAITTIFTQDPENYPKTSAILPLYERFLGNSLVIATGDDHVRLRAQLSPIFTQENVKLMDTAIWSSTNKFVTALKGIIKSSPSVSSLNSHAPKDDAVKIDAVHWGEKVALDIIGTAGLGHDFELGETPEGKRILASLNNIMQQSIMPASFTTGWVLRAFPFIVKLPISVIQAQGETKLIVRELAQAWLNDPEATARETSQKTILSVLKEMQLASGQTTESLLDHVVNFIIAGHESSGLAIAFAMYQLANHKDFQEQLRQEIKDFPNDEPSYDDFQNQLPLLDAACKEIMRLHPAAGFLERVAAQDGIIPLRFPVKNRKTGQEMNSVKIKKGQLIYVSHAAVNKLPTVWGPDAAEFRPERWLPGNPGASPLPNRSDVSKGWNGMMTFLEGPRLCIGFRLAVYDWKIVMFALLKNFELLPTGDKVETLYGSTTLLVPYVKGEHDTVCHVPVKIRCI